MHITLVRRQVSHRRLAVSVIVALLAFTFLCPLMHPGVASGNEQLCQYHPYGALLMGPLMSVLTAMLWGMGGWLVVLPREYRFRLFRPPRALLPQLP